MKILVGLGNPGKQHFYNRHNLGFLVIDAWVESKKETFRKTEFHADVAKVKVGEEDVLVLKPQTFMNRSGESLSQAMAFYKVPIEDVVVVYDELDLPAMKFRVKKGGGPGGHNGVRSILLIGDAFVRIRLGIGRPPHPSHDIADYVLGNLTAPELDFWRAEIPTLMQVIDLCLAGKSGEAMNRFNRKD